jgi:hypothetical protein
MLARQGSLMRTPTDIRPSRLLVCLCTVCVLLFSLSGVALAETSDPFSGTKNPSTETTATPTTTGATTTGETSTSIPSSILILALVAGGVLIGGIAFVILRDARRVAPVGDSLAVEGSTRAATAAKQRKRRAKAKEARRQRKRNR